MLCQSAAGQFLGPLLFLVYTSELFSILKNKLISYADESTLMAIVLSPGDSVTVGESLNRDFDRVSQWNDLWEIKLNADSLRLILSTGHAQCIHSHPR